MRDLKSSLFLFFFVVSFVGVSQVKAQPKNLLPDETQNKKGVIESKKELEPAKTEIEIKDIQVQELNLLELDSIGLYYSQGNSYGTDLWEGSDMSFLDLFIPKLSLYKNSLVTNTILNKFLLTSAPLPSGKSDYENGWFFRKKIEILFQGGNFNKVLEMLENVPEKNFDEEFRKTKFESLLLSNSIVKACEEADFAMENYSYSNYWNKAFNFCLYQRKEQDKALLGISLMKEELDPDNQKFIDIFDLVTIEKARLDKNYDYLSPLEIVFLRYKPKSNYYPIDIKEDTPLWLVKALAFCYNAPIELRIKAGERAVLAGLIDANFLKTLYRQYQIEEDIENPLEWAENNYGIKARALLFQEAEKRKVIKEQARAIAKALSLAEKHGDVYITQAKSYVRNIYKIPRTPELIWFARHAIKAFATAGFKNRAILWYDFAKKLEGVKPEATIATTVNAPLLNILQKQSIVTLTQGYYEKLEKSLKEIGYSDKQTADYIQKMLSVYEAFGTKIRDLDWEHAKKGTIIQECVCSNPVLLSLRNKAVEEERKAEIITLSLLSLGEDFPLKTCTDNFSNVMKDLLEAGLDYDAKNLALEYFIRN